MATGGKNVVNGVIEFVIGLALLPTAGGFYYIVSNDANLSAIIGFVAVIGVGMVMLGIGITYNAYKKIVGNK